MDEVRRAIEAGELTPAQVARLLQVIRSALREEGRPTRDRAGSGSRRPAR